MKIAPEELCLQTVFNLIIFGQNKLFKTRVFKISYIIIIIIDQIRIKWEF